MSSGVDVVCQHHAGTLFFHPDHLGSSSILSGREGEVTSDILYYPYGGIFSGLLPDSTAYLYTGQEFDGENELYYYGARYYSAELGRFISADPINRERPGSEMAYAYVENNPLLFIDPTGESMIAVDPEQVKKSQQK